MKEVDSRGIEANLLRRHNGALTQYIGLIVLLLALLALMTDRPLSPSY